MSQISGMSFRAQEVYGAFEKRAPESNFKTENSRRKVTNDLEFKMSSNSEARAPGRIMLTDSWKDKMINIIALLLANQIWEMFHEYNIKNAHINYNLNLEAIIQKIQNTKSPNKLRLMSWTESTQNRRVRSWLPNCCKH